jgi:probable rRNA maturation factor
MPSISPALKFQKRAGTYSKRQRWSKRVEASIFGALRACASAVAWSRSGAMPVIARYEGLGRPALSVTGVSVMAQRMLDALRLSNAKLSLLLCDDQVIHALNREHRAKDRPTDVLAFAMSEGAPVMGDSALLGDVVISLVTAARQARAASRSLHDEVMMLLAHGLLHLLGDDHQTDAQERRMTARTDMLRSVGGVSAARNTKKIAGRSPRRPQKWTKKRS